MLKRYFPLLAGLLLGLGACSTDANKQAGKQTGPAPEGKVAASVPAVDTASALSTAQPVLPVPAPASAPEPDTENPASQASPRPPKRGATTLADVGETNDSLAVLNEEGVASRAELEQFLASGLPAAQSFRVRPGRDTMVVGKQGTQLLIAADAWDLPAGSPPVQLEVQEFYDPVDMVLAGLSTTSGPRLLETGGMLNLKATVNGQPVQLRPGAYVHLRMPAKEAQPGMQLFEGSLRADSTHGIDWQLPTPKLAQKPAAPASQQAQYRKFRARKNWSSRQKRKSRPKPKPGEGQDITAPEYVRGEKGFRKDLTTLIDYPEALRRRLRRGRRISKSEREVLRHASTETKERILRAVTVWFRVDSMGVTRSTLSNTDPEVAAAITTAIQQLPAWEPSWLEVLNHPDSLEAVTVSRRVHIYFAESGKVIVQPEPWDLAGARSSHNKVLYQQQGLARLAQRRRLDSLYAARPAYYDSLRAKEQVRARAEMERIRTQFADTSTAEISEYGVYNELSAQGLGWINCDRYLGPGPLITYGINTGKTGAVVTLLFRGYNSIMKGSTVSASRYEFDNVPVGRTATVVAIRRVKGITYLSARGTIIGPVRLSGFNFRPVTMPELRAEIARLR